MKKIAFFLFVCLLSLHLFSQHYDQKIIVLAKKYAPILAFHPQENCFLGDAELFFNTQIKPGKFFGEKNPTSLDTNAPCYFQYSMDCYEDFILERIVYWFFYTYNDAHNEFAIGNHIGDWESVELILVNSEPSLYILSCHENLYKRYIKVEEARIENNQIVVCVALGTHANYECESPKNIYRKKLLLTNWHDEVASSTLRLNTSINLIPISQTAFGNYRGRWGDPESPVVRQFETPVEVILSIIGKATATNVSGTF